MRVLGLRLPCGHRKVRVGEHRAVWRKCRTCKRVFVGEVVRSIISDHVGTEVRRVVWTERTKERTPA